MLKIGLIGAGWHAVNDHGPALRHCADGEEFRGRVELTGVCDIHVAKAEDAAARFGFRRAYDSIEALLGDVDAVMAIVPPAAMAATLQTIVQHSRPALIERPLGRDLAEARHIAMRLEAHPHMVSLNRRFDPAVQAARRWMADQSSLRIVHGIMMRHNRIEPDFAWSTGVHLCDVLCSFAGPLTLANGRCEKTKRIGHFNGFADGRPLRGGVELWPAARQVEEMIHLAGAGWSIKIDTGTHKPWRVQCWRSNRGHSPALDVTADPATPPFIRNATAYETAAFLRGVLSGRMTGPTATDAMSGTELAAALQALGESGTYHGSRE